jgi:hypothetical protein
MFKTERINIVTPSAIPILAILLAMILLIGVSISQTVIAVMDDNKTGMMMENKTGMMMENKTGMMEK